MNPNNTTNILWLSDFHFQDYYQNVSCDKYDKELTDNLNDYLSKFINIISQQHTTNPIEYVILGGDIAMKGTYADYSSFFSLLLVPLLDEFLFLKEKKSIEIPKVISFPGNHDVNWSNASFLIKYLNEAVAKKSSYTQRATFLKENETDFFELFSNYTFSMNSLAAENSKYFDFFNFNKQNGVIACKDYSEKKLFGHIIDKKKGILFFIINTAWFSVGDSINELLAGKNYFHARVIEEAVNVNESKTSAIYGSDYAKKEKYFSGQADVSTILELKQQEMSKIINPHPKEFYDSLFKILKEKDSLIEYGKQISGLNLIEEDFIKNLIEKYNDYIIVTCMHHPLNWLEWNERFDIETDSSPLSSNFRFVLNNSDLLLTGHEHIPKENASFEKLKQLNHLKAGCFLDDNRNFPLEATGNWFSLLRVDSRLRTVQQEIFTVNNDSNTFNWSLHTSKKVNSESLNFRPTYLSGIRKKEILKLVNSTTKEKVKNYLDNYLYLSNLNNVSLHDIDSPNHSFYEIFCIKSVNITEIIFLVKKNSFYNHIISKNFISLVDTLVLHENKDQCIVRFLVPDLLVEKNISNKYSNNMSINNSDYFDREFVLTVIYKKADTLFDNFRKIYFSRFENTKHKKGIEKSSQINLSQLKHVMFVNHIIPFWEFEAWWS